MQHAHGEIHIALVLGMLVTVIYAVKRMCVSYSRMHIRRGPLVNETISPGYLFPGMHAYALQQP